MKRILSNLNMVAAVLLALVVVQLVSFIALRNPQRWDWSGRKYYALSEKTTNLLDALEQRVEITVFFQEEYALYLDIENLLEEYQYHSRNIHVEWVDPARDLARTEKLAMKYGLTEPRVVVFDIEGKSKVVREADLADYRMVRGRREPVLSAFKGEQAFSSAIHGLVQGETPVVYFLVGHGEHRVKEFDQDSGYSRIGTTIFRDNLELRELMLTETQVPEDAAAVVIAGPSKAMSVVEAEMIEDYLGRSGRVMVLLDALEESGLEAMLRRWGVALRNDVVLDPENTLKGGDVYVRTYYEHPITLRMGDAGARFYLPRSIEPLVLEDRSAEAGDRPVVVQLAMTSEKSWSETQVDEPSAKFDENTGDQRRAFSLAVAVERGATRNVLDVQIRPSRMVVFGDSDFVANGGLTGGGQDLFMSALNWLLDREVLMAISPKPIEEVKLSLTRKQLDRLFWINVAGIPSVAIVSGLLVWFRRRK